MFPTIDENLVVLAGVLVILAVPAWVLYAYSRTKATPIPLRTVIGCVLLVIIVGVLLAIVVGAPALVFS